MQLSEDSLQGDAVVSGRPALLLAVLEKMANARFVECSGAKLAILEPLTQMSDSPQSSTG